MLRTLVIGFTVSIAACSPYDPGLGSEPFLCDPAAPACPDGYTCKDDGTGVNACTSPGAPDAGAGFACADDTVLEGPSKNDTIANASATPIDARKTVKYSGLAICPAGDKDTYRVDVTLSNENLKATVVYNPTAEGGIALSVSILNSGGISVANGGPMGENTVIANLPNLAVASSPYYVQVYGPPSGENNYSLQLDITP